MKQKTLYAVYGLEQDWLKDFETIEEAKKFIKDCKRFDKENEFEDIYYIYKEKWSDGICFQNRSN